MAQKNELGLKVSLPPFRVVFFASVRTMFFLKILTSQCFPCCPPKVVRKAFEYCDAFVVAVVDGFSFVLILMIGIGPSH